MGGRRLWDVHEVSLQYKRQNLVEFSKNNGMTASVGQMVDEKFIVHHLEVVMLERDLAGHCRRIQVQAG